MKEWLACLLCSRQYSKTKCQEGFPGGSDVKVSACNAGDLCSITGSRRSPGEGKGNPLQYSCLENPMDREAWQTTVHRVTQCQTQLKKLSMHCTGISKKKKYECVCLEQDFKSREGIEKAAQGREKKQQHSKRECTRANNTYVSKFLW